MVSSLLGGKGPGLLSVGLSALAFDYFILPPRFHLLAFAAPASYLRFAPFLGATLLVVGIAASRNPAAASVTKLSARYGKRSPI
jgi:K+-sensing histidine kinase KdpD